VGEQFAGRRRQGLVLALVVVGVLLSTINANAQAELIRRRQDTCDGSLPLPTAAYVLGFAGLVVGAVALFLLGRWFRHSRSRSRSSCSRPRPPPSSSSSSPS
jgi:hypothetical protein